MTNLSSTFVDLRINNAEQFKESVSEAANNKLYLVFGRALPWANDSNPPAANSCVGTINEIWDNMIGGKRIFSNDMAFVIPRYTWTSNTVYTAYDHLSTNLYDEGNTKFYVVTSDWNVYKCIANNYGKVSTIEPTTLNPASVAYQADGYAWKYMYTVSDAEKLRFMTGSYMPVKTLTGNDSSLQWQVQANAKVGSIESIWVTDQGTNYTNTSNIIVSISGDGLYATATASINSISNTVNSISITNPGTGYTWATVTISDAGLGSGANARAIISPPGGHGSDPLYELGGKNVMLNPRIRYNENGILPVTNDYRQIAVLKDPHKAGTDEGFGNTAFLQAMGITTAGFGDYQLDEYVYQGTSFAAASFKASVVGWDSANNKLTLINTQGTPTAAQTLVGATSFTIRTITSVTEGELEEYTGRILYADNFTPITRSSDQIEDYKICIRF